MKPIGIPDDEVAQQAARHTPPERCRLWPSSSACGSRPRPRGGPGSSGASVQPPAERQEAGAEAGGLQSLLCLPDHPGEPAHPRRCSPGSGTRRSPLPPGTFPRPPPSGVLHVAALDPTPTVGLRPSVRRWLRQTPTTAPWNSPTSSLGVAWDRSSEPARESGVAWPIWAGPPRMAAPDDKACETSWVHA